MKGWIPMKKRTVFLRWAMFAILIVTGAYAAQQAGWIGYVQDDPTHVTYITLSVFVLATLWCGRMCWALSSDRDPDDIDIDLKLGHYASSLCVSIGLIGTAVGYYLMLKGGSAQGQASEIIKRTFANASIAIVNTVVGGICGVLIEIQSKFIEHAAARAEKRIVRMTARTKPAAPSSGGGAP